MKNGDIMTLKRIKIIGIFTTFVLCFLTHFIYDIFPNFLTSIFFPVNESIWEHIKMMTSTMLIWEVIEYFLLKKYLINYNNFSFSIFVTLIVSIPVFILIYYPIYKCVGSVFILNILCLFITIYFSYIVSYYIMKSKKLNLNFIGTTGIICLYIIFALFTYNPPKTEIFVNPVTNSYGLIK